MRNLLCHAQIRNLLISVAPIALLTTADSCDPAGTCLDPAPDTVCEDVCKNREDCFTCCSRQYPNDVLLETFCNTACNQRFGWSTRASGDGANDTADGGCCGEDWTTVIGLCEQSPVFHEIVGAIPAAADTQTLRDFICWLDSDSREQLRDEILAQQALLWAISDAEYSKLYEYVDDYVPRAVDRLIQGEFIEESTPEIERDLRNYFLYQMWLDFVRGELQLPL